MQSENTKTLINRINHEFPFLTMKEDVLGIHGGDCKIYRFGFTTPLFEVDCWRPVDRDLCIISLIFDGGPVTYCGDDNYNAEFENSVINILNEYLLHRNVFELVKTKKQLQIVKCELSNEKSWIKRLISVLPEKIKHMERETIIQHYAAKPGSSLYRDAKKSFTSVSNSSK